jgi:hypothetical protein
MDTKTELGINGLEVLIKKCTSPFEVMVAKRKRLN